MPPLDIPRAYVLPKKIHPSPFQHHIPLGPYRRFVFRSMTSSRRDKAGALTVGIKGRRRWEDEGDAASPFRPRGAFRLGNSLSKSAQRSSSPHKIADVTGNHERSGGGNRGRFMVAGSRASPATPADKLRYRVFIDMLFPCNALPDGAISRYATDKGACGIARAQ